MIYYLPAGAEQGDWLPELPDAETRPTVKADTIRLIPDKRMADPLPTRWVKLKKESILITMAFTDAILCIIVRMLRRENCLKWDVSVIN